MIDRSYVYLTRGPRENRLRPSVDPLFRSAAVVYGPHVVGVVLTGTLDDGASGLGAIRRCGGIAVVQNPDDAACAEMPRSAAEHVEVDYSVPLSQMGELPGRPRDEQGAIRASPRRPIEREAPPIMDRAPVTTPRQTGPQVIDALGSAERWHARPRCVDGTGAGSKGFMGCN